MADRIRVTSLIGGTPRMEGPSGTKAPRFLAWVAGPRGPGTPNRVSRQLLSATRETADEYTSRPAQLLDFSGTPLTISPSSRREESSPATPAASRPPVRPAYRRTGLPPP